MTGRPPRKNSVAQGSAGVSCWRPSPLASRSSSQPAAPTTTRSRSKRPSSRSWTSRAFQRVLVAGFVAGGSEDVDANQETVRLLRSQLRTKSSLKVIDADILPLHRSRPGSGAGLPRDDADATRLVRTTPSARTGRRQALALPQEHQGREGSRSRTSACSRTPRIGSGSARNSRIRSSSPARCCSRTDRPSGFVQRDQEVFDSLGRRRVDAGPHLHGTQGLRPPPQVRLHRRPDRRDDVLRELPRRDPLQRPAEHAGAVVLFRAHGPPGPEFPQRAQQPEDSRHPRALR